MDCDRGRIQCELHILWRLLFIAVLVPPANVTAEPTLPSAVRNREAIEATLRNDAALKDVCFVDASSGWAVGDRGVIWHTRDGGITWQLQHSRVDCRLNSVCFIDQRRGWAVGGANLAYGRSTQGVVLRTIDAGTTWERVPGLVVPLLNGTRFFNANVGIAVGEGASANPAGAFITRDGGQSWQPLTADQTGHWLAADFLDVDAGAVAGRSGQFATVINRRVTHSPLATASLRSARAMRLIAPAGGWLAGDGGLLMSTRDLGHSWQSPLAELPDNAGDHFDFHALAVHGEHVWVGGSPGTRVFHSADGGQSWQAYSTGSLTPLRGLSFVDDRHGWAVGDLGRILATSDGGQTWHVQRAGGQRAALLAVFAKATDVPLELIAEQGAAEAYITAVDILHGEPSSNERTSEAMLAAGAAAAEATWRFPLPSEELAFSPDDLLAALNRATDGRAIQQLQDHLVRQLRTWRPEIVVTHSRTAQTGPSTAAMLEQLVIRSVEAAADPSQFAELASHIGLPPWQVKRVYGVLPPGSRGEEAIATSRFSPWLGASLAEWVAPARRLLFETHTPPPATYELRMLSGEPAGDNVASVGGSNGANRGFFGGIALAHGSDARRAAPELPTNDLDDLRRLATRRSHLEKLLERSEGNATWAGHVATLTEGLDAGAGAELLFQLANGYRETGRLDLAADTYYLLSRRYAEHPLAEPALVWLVQFYASSEAAHRSAAHGATNLRATPLEGEPASDNIASAGGDVQQSSAITPIPQHAPPAIGLSPDDRLRRAVQLVDYLKTARPMLYADPAVRFAEVAAQRQLGYSNAAKRYFLTLDQHPPNDPWRRCAETEQWLAEPGDLPPPKTLAACRRISERPHLDGQLDEPFWDTADRLRLGDPDGSSAALESAGQVRMVYDSEFLYLAVWCPRAAGTFRPDDSPRPRDADLRQHDRVAIRLDLDRDFTTAFEFTVDHRGWTHDACWGDGTWNPSWYVAAASDESEWTMEAAVPLAELVGEQPAAKHVWAVAVRRTIPRVGYESWPGQSGTENSPDQFGLLIFE